MEQRLLGRTGISVSLVGLGTVKLGRASGVKYPTPVQIPGDDAAAALLAAAADLGITLLDTAPAYGPSEERLGKLLSGQRDRWTICTKVGESFDGAASHFDFSPAAVRESVERSLRRLRTERVDIVLLHSDGIIESSPAREETLLALLRARDAGLVRAVGASTKTLDGAAWWASHADVLMLAPPDLGGRSTSDAEARRAFDLAAASGCGVLVKKALRSGHAALGADPAGARAALRHAAGLPGVSSLIVGTTSIDHLSENARALAD